MPNKVIRKSRRNSRRLSRKRNSRRLSRRRLSKKRLSRRRNSRRTKSRKVSKNRRNSRRNIKRRLSRRGGLKNDCSLVFIEVNIDNQVELNKKLNLANNIELVEKCRY